VRALSYRRHVTDATTPAVGVGATLEGRYRLDAEAGRGGYATVYRAHDLELGRDVAVKVFAAAAADAADSPRIASETRLLAAVAHPSLVTLYDARLAHEPAYLVMEFIDGPTLSAMLTSGPLRPSHAAALAVELAEALHVIHERGIVHRDIKPSNVLLRPPALPSGSPRATLADFGIAALVDSARVTATGTLVGTAAYLSPEQARGQRAGTPTDVYALGLVLLEALSGRRAFAQATPHEALAARLVSSPEIPADLPPDWRAVLSAMTALDPAHRPDAHAVVRAAERLRALPDATPGAATRTAVLAGGPGEGAPARAMTAEAPTRVLPSPDTAPPPPARSGRRPRGRRWLIVAVSAVVLVAAVPATAVAVSTLTAVPDPAPTLPALPSPLDEHFGDLLDEVSR
jgi:eukaryotic-like serine/threonine-protein kinase